MTADVSDCPDHGFFEGADCPVCAAPGERVLSGDRRRRLSKFVSGALRHFPDDAGIALDEAGWTTFADLAEAVAAKYDWADRRALDALVATDPKGRFERAERDGEAVVRAAYGHSIDVDLDVGDPDSPVPDGLYHGTAPRNLDAIREEGLRPMGRQRVHLSESVSGAREVGSRHADDPVVLEVDAAGLRADGHRIAKRGRATFTTDRVPPAYLSVLDEE